MLALRNACAIVLSAVTLAAAISCRTPRQQLVPARPDLTVSVRAVPNPVPFNMAFEVQIIIANTAPAAELAVPPPPVGRAPDEIPAPPVSPVEVVPPGADVRITSVVLPTANFIGGRVDIQADPTLGLRNCQLIINSPPRVAQAERCAIGPLKKGGSWMITLVFSCPARAEEDRFSAAIDDGQFITERDESNNYDAVWVKCQPRV
jgi:hypothetical protein